ncbi:MAG: hypothetical protein PHD67_03800 [Oscillospiraceae bacterium]|nr:hypothetical protein [Oscillospiraceae bacterium]
MWKDIQYNHTEAGRYRKTVQKMQNTLIENRIENILSYLPRTKAIRTDMVECDYFDFLERKPQAIRKYAGKYLEQYSWAEETKGYLDSIKLQYEPDAADSLYRE